MRTFTDRLREIVGKHRHAFAKKSGLTMHQLRLYLDDGLSPSIDVAARISEAAGVSLHWLVYGEGDKAVPDAPSEPPPPAGSTLH